MLKFRCPTYNNLPSSCREVKKAGDCCTTVQCSSGTFISSTGNLATIGGGGLIQVPGSGSIAPTLPSGGTPQPGTGGTSFMAPSLSKPLHKECKLCLNYISLSQTYLNLDTHFSKLYSDIISKMIVF